MKKTLLFVWLFTLIISGIAQISYQERLEFDLKDGYVDEKVIVFGETGFIISSRKSESSNHQNEWRYEQFDNTLQSVHAVSVLLNNKFYPNATYTNDQRTHTIYEGRKGNYSIVSVEASSLEVTKVNFVLPKKADITEMAILGDYAFLKATIKKTSFLYSVNWKTGAWNTMPITIQNLNPKKITLDAIQVLEYANEVLLYVKAQIDKKHTDTYVIRLNDQGEKMESINLSKNIDKNIIEISASKWDDTKCIFTGTYSSKYTSLSEGIFFCQTDNDDLDYMKFYSFLDLKNFLSYLPERKQNRIEKKKKRKEKQGEEYTINYQISAHDIIPVEDGYLFLGEAFYPTYRTETHTTTTFVNGRSTTTTYTTTVFDGYQYTHAMLCKFDTEGNLVWDQIFEMWSAYKPFYIKQFISIAAQDLDAIKLVFASRNKIISKSIDYEGLVIQDIQSEELQTNFEGDRSRYSFSDIDFWYDNYFIAYGQQKIKNTDGDNNVKRTRRVFFVSKIKF